MVSFFVFLLGLVVGSFLNAFIYRLEVQQGMRQVAHNRKKSEATVWRGRSFCPSCGHALAFTDLLPLLSFVLLKGRCRHCKGKISLQYPVVELATGLLFVAVLSLVVENLTKLSFPQVAQILYLWVIASALIVIFVYDLKHYIIPDKVLYPTIGLVVAWDLLLSFGGVDNLTKLSFAGAVLSGIGAAGFFFAIYILSKGKWMGFGDVKLALFMGLFLGFPGIVTALFAAFLTGALVGVALVASSKKRMRSEVPFGPFLVAGTIIAFFFGEQLFNIYLSFLLVY